MFLLPHSSGIVPALDFGSSMVSEGAWRPKKPSVQEPLKLHVFMGISSVSSVSQSCPTLCNPMDCSTPGLPVHHQLLEFTQTHVHRVGDAIQPSYPLSSPSPPSPNPFQHQGLFQ